MTRFHRPFAQVSIPISQPPPTKRGLRSLGWLAWSTPVCALLVSGALMWVSLQADRGALHVHLERQHQTIEGFGAFGAAKVWWEPGPHFDARFVEAITDDLGSTLVRTQLYWDGEPENDDDLPESFAEGRFRFGPDSDNGKQFGYLRALAAKKVRILASVWTPPPWMKKDPDDALAPFCSGQCGGTLAPAHRVEFAEYLVAYLRKFREEVGSELFALSIQNEPLFANPFESCVYTAEEYAGTLREVGRRIAQEGLTTRLFGPEHMADFGWNEQSGLFAHVLDDPSVSRYLNAYAVHGYADGQRPALTGDSGWTHLARRAQGAGKALWMTETSEDGDEEWSSAFRQAQALHLALERGNVEAWLYWTYAGRLLAGEERRPLFHLLKHWFKYVRPGYVRIEAVSPDARLRTTAFHGNDRLVLVVLNPGQEAHQATLAVTGAVAPRELEVFRTRFGGEHRREHHARPDRLTFPPQSVTTLVGLLPGGDVAENGSSKAPAAVPPGRRSFFRGCAFGDQVGGSAAGLLFFFGTYGVRRARRSSASTR